MLEDRPYGDPAAGASALNDDELDRICFQNLLAGEPEMIYFKDLGGRFVRVSQGHVELFNARSTADVIGKTDFDFFAADHARQAFADEQRIIRTGEALVEVEEEETWPDRESSWVVTTKQPLRDGDGTIIGTFGLSRSITERKRLTLELEHRTNELTKVERELRRLLETSPDPILRYDVELRLVYANPAAQELLAGSAAGESVVGHTNSELGLSSAFLDEWDPALRRVIATGEPSDFEFASGEPLSTYLHVRVNPEFDEDGAASGVFVIARDLTERKRAEDALAERAVHDPLTGLANRVLLTDRIQQALVRLERTPGRLAVLFLDLDRFKVVNDSLGHTAGDALLVEVGRRLSAVARRSDTVARFGGDEFVMLCERISALEDAAVVAGRITQALAEPVMYEGQLIHVSGSIGIATTEDSNTNPAALLRDADAAMYLAKQRGHGDGSYHFFDAGVRERAVARLTVEGELRRAIENEEFVLVYQPLVTMDDVRDLIGFEALIRWQHPDRGLLAPSEFMGVAEDTNLIIPIGRWVLSEACRQLAEWNAMRAGDNQLTMAVNVSARQLSHPSLLTVVADALRAHGVAPHLLTIEITETSLLEEATASGAVLAELAALGVQVALDDFGTGYSSLGHLRRFQVNILKIDRSFVDGLDTGHGDAAIVAAVTAMARALGMTTIGEGIETAGQFDALRALGCDDGQGYLVAHPMSPQEISDRRTLGPNTA